MNRIRVFPSGEIEVRSVLEGSRSRPPEPSHGRRMVRGVSRHGSRKMRRSVSALVQAETCQVAMYTLQSQDPDLSDRDFKRRLLSLLAWGRKYLGPFFKHYAWVIEPQQRGVLHAHLLLFKRIPKGLWRRMRTLWCETYGMGPGSFDVKPIRRASRAAAYMAKVTSYMSKRPEAFRVSLDGEGALSFEPWRVSRHNGKPYERVEFAGNAYGISDALRLYAVPVTELWMDWGHGPLLDAVNLHGAVRFFDSPELAEAWLSSALDPPVSGSSRPLQA